MVVPYSLLTLIGLAVAVSIARAMELAGSSFEDFVSDRHDLLNASLSREPSAGGDGDFLPSIK